MTAEQHEDACCPECRLMQQPADQCRSCGYQAPRIIDETPEQFLAEHEGWWPILWLLWILPGTPLFVLAVIWSLALVDQHISPVFKAIGGDDAAPYVVALSIGVHFSIMIAKIRRRKKSAHLRQRLTPMPRLAPEPERDVKRTGVVRGLSGTILTHITAAPCLVSSLEFHQGLGRQVCLRFMRSADFVLQEEDGKPVVVRGEVMLGSGLTSRRASVAETQPMLRTISAHLPIYARMMASLSTLQEGDRVEILGGSSTMEVVDELAGHYREGQATTVIRGEPGQPIFIQGITRP